MNLFVAITLGDAVAARFLPSRQVAESGDQTLKLEYVWILLPMRFSFSRLALLQNTRIFFGINRETMFAIPNVEFTARAIEDQLQLATFQNSAVVIMQNRHQHFSLKFLFQRVPVDIKKASIGRSLAVLENVEPPGIVTAHHPHMVGHDVQNQSHAMFM